MSTRTTNLGLTIPALGDAVPGTITALGENFQKLDGLAYSQRLLRRVVTAEEAKTISFPVDDLDLSNIIDLRLTLILGPHERIISNKNARLYPNGSTSYACIQNGTNSTSNTSYLAYLYLSQQTAVFDFGTPLPESNVECVYRSSVYAQTGEGSVYFTEGWIEVMDLTWAELKTLDFICNTTSATFPAQTQLLLTGFQYA